MPHSKHCYRIQNSAVFANCFRRPHFARKVLEGVFRHNISSLDTQNLEFQTVTSGSGEEITAVKISGIKFADGTTIAVVVYVDMGDNAEFTARMLDLINSSANDGTILYIMSFCHSLEHLHSRGSVMKFTMCDIVGNRLCDRRWEYFVRCKYADKLEDPFVKSLCKMLRGDKCTTDEASIIEDTCTSIISELGLEIPKPSALADTGRSSTPTEEAVVAEDPKESADATQEEEQTSEEAPAVDNGTVQ